MDLTLMNEDDRLVMLEFKVWAATLRAAFDKINNGSPDTLTNHEVRAIARLIEGTDDC